ncbi:hypothetical protein RB195_016838 [Necator americanus]|uniref:Collagen triple helix repeat protein n=1 Tax=Necator americanus TaxID=51031 RepID=A0ABR1C4X9_NECAM
MMILVLLILSVAQLSSGQGGFPDGPGLGGFPNGPGQGGFPNGPGHGFPNGPVGGGVGAGGFGPNGGVVSPMNRADSGTSQGDWATSVPLPPELVVCLC